MVALAAIARRLLQIEAGNFGDWKFVGDGIREIRLHQGPGYRIYFEIRDKEIILLLCGGDKSSRKRDIELAKRIAKAWVSEK